MRRSAVDEYLDPAGGPPPQRAPPQRAPPPPPWAEQVQQEGLRDFTIPEVRQAYGSRSRDFLNEQARRAQANSADYNDFMGAYRSRINQNPASTFRSAPPPQQDQGRAPQPYAGVGVGAREDPGGGGPEERAPQEYASAPGGRYNPYEDIPDPYAQPGQPAGTGPPRGPGGAPQAPQPAPQPAPAPFQNADEAQPEAEDQAEYLGEVWTEETSYRPVTVNLPFPFNTPENIKAKFGPLPKSSSVIRAIGLAFHPDKGGTPEQFQNAVIAVNNAYKKYVVGQGKRRKYRY